MRNTSNAKATFLWKQEQKGVKYYLFIIVALLLSSSVVAENHSSGFSLSGQKKCTDLAICVTFMLLQQLVIELHHPLVLLELQQALAQVEGQRKAHFLQ